MIKRNCLHYNELVETDEVFVGYRNEEPIYEPEYSLVGLYCSKKKEYNFKCEGCPYFSKEEQNETIPQ